MPFAGRKFHASLHCSVSLSESSVLELLDTHRVRDSPEYMKEGLTKKKEWARNRGRERKRKREKNREREREREWEFE